MTDSATFWGTVAQIVPVLFLAVMIEFRWSFSRMSKTQKEFMATRVFRATTGLYLLVVAGCLCFVLISSLSSLRRGDPADGDAGYITLLVLSAAIGLGMGGPAVALAGIASQDVWTTVHRKMPWSTIAKAKRSIARSEEEQRRQDRQIRDLMLRLRQSLAAHYVSASRLELAAMSLTGPERATADADAREMYRFADERKAEIDELSRTRPSEVQSSNLPVMLEAEQERYRSRLAELANRGA